MPLFIIFRIDRIFFKEKSPQGGPLLEFIQVELRPAGEIKAPTAAAALAAAKPLHPFPLRLCVAEKESPCPPFEPFPAYQTTSLLN